MNKGKKQNYTVAFAIFLIMGLVLATVGAGGAMGKLGSNSLTKLDILGNSNVGADQDWPSANYVYASSFTCQTTETLSSVVAYVAGYTSSVNMIAGVYSSGGGYPTTLLATSNSFSVGTSFSWVTFPLNSNPTISAGTYYLAIVGDGTSMVTLDEQSGNTVHYPDQFYSGLNNPFGQSWGEVSEGMSIYATTVAAATPTPTPAPNTSVVTLSATGGTITMVYTYNGVVTTDSVPASYNVPKAVTITMTETPTGSNTFDHWVINGVIQTGTPYSYYVAGDSTITGIFDYPNNSPVPTATPTATPQPTGTGTPTQTGNNPTSTPIPIINKIAAPNFQYDFMILAGAIMVAIGAIGIYKLYF